MTVGTWLNQTVTQFTAASIQTARLDALILLEDALKKDRTQLLAHPEWDISTTVQNVLDQQVARRMKHEPVAYIRGTCSFYGRDFAVSPAVLVPRPESETMIDLLKELLRGTALSGLLPPNKVTAQPANHSAVAAIKNQSIHPVVSDSPATPVRLCDVGTGSGALGITAALELKNCSVDLLDIEPKALEVAKVNVIRLTTLVSVVKSDLLPENAAYDVLLCNLPYIPINYYINKAAEYEPKIALYGGTDGLDLYRKLFLQVANLQMQPLLILTEALPEQHIILKQLAYTAGYSEHQESDFIQAFVMQ